ncbi:hypothetical protein [Nocardia altamirensis]|uniref:hypothetical protein n=1 Tax=Nocardia altamirensis TaxID=472158 RepID=UPI00114CE632|nr:hypothetical protein [Nocardia altamirensis]
MPLPLPAKIDRLVEYSHRYGEPAMTNPQIADALTERLGRTVTSAFIAALRDGSTSDIPKDLAAELCALCRCPDPAYLTPARDEDVDIDQRLRLWTLARDRGLKHLAARAPGAMTREMMEELIADIGALPLRA